MIVEIVFSLQGEGTVQINCEVGEYPGSNRPRINIVDILKPAEEVDNDVTPPSPPPPRQQPVNVREARIGGGGAAERAVTAAVNARESNNLEKEEEEEVTRWVVDQQFRKEQERLGIPLDPLHWTPFHVAHWIRWAIGKFRLHR